jgi:hypothetical protein
MFAQLVPTTEMVPADDTVVGSCWYQLVIHDSVVGCVCALYTRRLIRFRHFRAAVNDSHLLLTSVMQNCKWSDLSNGCTELVRCRGVDPVCYLRRPRYISQGCT